MAGAYSICTATFGNGATIGSGSIRQTQIRSEGTQPARSGSFGVEAGSAPRASAGPITAFLTHHPTEATLWASAWLECSFKQQTGGNSHGHQAGGHSFSSFL